MGGTILSPFILPVASIIPLGLSIGIVEQIYPSWKKVFKWFAPVGFLAIAITSIGGMEGLRKIAVPVFYGVAGMVIFLGPTVVEKKDQAPKDSFGSGLVAY